MIKRNSIITDGTTVGIMKGRMTCVFICTDTAKLEGKWVPENKVRKLQELRLEDVSGKGFE